MKKYCIEINTGYFPAELEDDIIQALDNVAPVNVLFWTDLDTQLVKDVGWSIRGVGRLDTDLPIEEWIGKINLACWKANNSYLHICYKITEYEEPPPVMEFYSNEEDYNRLKTWM